MMDWKKILIGEEKTLKHTSEDGSVKVEFSYRAGLLPNLALVGGLGLLVWWLVKKQTLFESIISDC